jgi:hypothetical protein
MGKPLGKAYDLWLVVSTYPIYGIYAVNIWLIYGYYMVIIQKFGEITWLVVSNHLVGLLENSQLYKPP